MESVLPSELDRAHCARACGHRQLAAGRRRDGVRDGRRRRHHPADRKRACRSPNGEPISGAIPPLDARDWDAGVRALQGNARISAGQRPRGHGRWRSSSRSSSGNGSTACSAGVIGLAFALPLAWFAVPPRDPARLWLEARRPAAARRRPGCARLVHGDVRASPTAPTSAICACPPICCWRWRSLPR